MQTVRFRQILHCVQDDMIRVLEVEKRGFRVKKRDCSIFLMPMRLRGDCFAPRNDSILFQTECGRHELCGWLGELGPKAYLHVYKN